MNEQVENWPQNYSTREFKQTTTTTTKRFGVSLNKDLMRSAFTRFVHFFAVHCKQQGQFLSYGEDENRKGELNVVN